MKVPVALTPLGPHLSGSAPAASSTRLTAARVAPLSCADSSTLRAAATQFCCHPGRARRQAAACWAGRAAK